MVRNIWFNGVSVREQVGSPELGIQGQFAHENAKQILSFVTWNKYSRKFVPWSCSMWHRGSTTEKYIQVSLI